MRPTLRFVLVFAAGIPVSVVAVLVSARLWTLWLAYLGGILVLAGVDALLSLPRRRLTVDVRYPDTLYIADRDELTLTLTTKRWRRPARLELLCDLDDDLVPHQPAWIDVPADGAAEAIVPLVPKRRGEVTLEKVWVRWTGPFGLLRRQVKHPLDRQIAVVPNTRAVRAAALRFFSAREFLAGLKVEHYVGDGSEFESLREYTPGLDHRAIDWKASARHKKLLCQEFRAERNHQVILAIDTGQLMSEPIGGVAKLDHAVNAGLMLSYFCLRTGDRVGLFGFDEKVRCFIEPAGGMQSFARLQRLSAGLDYQRHETNFTLGLADLATRLRRRSLVVLLTDFVDTITAELMLENVQRLARRHVVVFVTLRDPHLGEIAMSEPRTLDDLHRAVVAGDFERERDVVIQRLRRFGVHTLDVIPSQVSMSLLNRYLDIKRRELV